MVSAAGLVKNPGKPNPDVDWPVYGGTLENSHYSTLSTPLTYSVHGRRRRSPTGGVYVAFELREE